jgi:acyl-CoA thioesterase I
MGSEESVAAGQRRRAWLSHCTLLAVAAMATGAHGPSRAAPARTLLVVGDSLSAEYGLARDSGWVALLQKRLRQEKFGFAVVNASISGDTTSGGRSRLKALLTQHKPAVVVIELGGNDALRGLPLAMTQSNITEMARTSKAAGAKVLIAGMQVPPNYGRKYADEFAALFATVARAEGAALVPFLLEGVANAANADALFQADRIHPKAEAHPRMLDNLWPVLRPLLL